MSYPFGFKSNKAWIVKKGRQRVCGSKKLYAERKEDEQEDHLYWEKKGRGNVDDIRETENIMMMWHYNLFLLANFLI